MRKLFRITIPIGALGLVLAIVALLSSTVVLAQQPEPKSAPSGPYIERVTDEASSFGVASIEIPGVVDVAVHSITAVPNPALRTDSIHFEVVFRNNGNRQASGIDGAVVIDAGFGWAWHCFGCHWNPNRPPTGSSVFFQSQGLAPEETFTVTIDVYPNGLWPVKFIAGAWPEHEDYPDNNSQTLVVPIFSSQNPDIVVYPTLFRLDLASGETVTTSFTVTNTGADVLYWRSEPTEAWVSSTPVTGSVGPGQNEQVTMTVNTSGLAGGDYTGAIMVYSNDPDRPSEGVVTHLIVRAPRIVIAPSTQFKINLQSGEVVTRSMWIANLGNTPTGWQIEVTPTSWFSSEPQIGTIEPGLFDEVMLRFDATGLSEGVYSQVFHILSNDPEHPDILVSVLLVVGSADIEVIILDEPDPVNPGEQMSLLFATRNNSSLPVFGVVVKFHLESAILETVGTEFSFRLADLEPHQKLWWRLYGWVKPDTPGGVYPATVELTSGVADPNLANNLRQWKILVKPLLTFLPALVRGYPEVYPTPTAAVPPTVTPTIERPPDGTPTPPSPTPDGTCTPTPTNTAVPPETFTPTPTNTPVNPLFRTSGC